MVTRHTSSGYGNTVARVAGLKSNGFNRTPVLVLPCDSATPGAASTTTTGIAFGGNTTAAQDTTYWSTGSGASVKMTDGVADDVVYVDYTRDAGYEWDLTDTHMVVRYYIHEGATGITSYDNWTSAKVWLYDSAGAYETYYIYDTVGFGTAVYGWAIVPITFGEPSSAGGGTMDWSDINKVKIRFDSDANADTPSVSLDYVEFYKKPTVAKFMIRLGGNDDSLVNAAAAASEFGIKCVWYVKPDTIGGAGLVTQAQLERFQADGHLIANHGLNTLTTDWGSLTDAQKRDQILKSADQLRRIGFVRGADHFACPGTNWLATDEVNVYPYVCATRSASHIQPVGKGLTSSYDYTRMSIISFDEWDDADTGLDDVQTYGGLCVAACHTCEAGAGAAQMDKFRALLLKLQGLMQSGLVENVLPSDLVSDSGSRTPQIDVTTRIADPGNAGAIAVTRSGTCAMTSAGAETRTLAIPTFIGQMVSLVCDTYVGDIVITAASGINVANNTTMTFGAVSEYILLMGVSVGGTLAWQVISNDGVALA